MSPSHAEVSPAKSKPPSMSVGMHTSVAKTSPQSLPPAPCMIYGGSPRPPHATCKYHVWRDRPEACSHKWVRHVDAPSPGMGRRPPHNMRTLSFPKAPLWCARRIVPCACSLQKAEKLSPIQFRQTVESLRSFPQPSSAALRASMRAPSAKTAQPPRANKTFQCVSRCSSGRSLCFVVVG